MRSYVCARLRHAYVTDFLRNFLLHYKDLILLHFSCVYIHVKKEEENRNDRKRENENVKEKERIRKEKETETFKFDHHQDIYFCELCACVRVNGTSASSS